MLTTDAGAGGIQTAIGNYLAALADLGWPAMLAAPRGAPVLTSCLHGASALPFGRSALLRLSLGLGGPLAGAVRGADVVLVHNNRLIGPVRRRGRPVVAVAHGDKPHGLADATAVITINTAFRARLVAGGLDHRRVHHVPHFLPVQPPVGGHGGPAAVPTLAAGGRFVAKKGFDDFLRAAAVAGLARAGWRVVLAGTGPLHDDLRALARRLGLAVTFPGWVPIQSLLAETDVFCLPSRDEPFGLVLLEAMAAGRCCVASATNGPRDLVAAGVDGLLYPPGDVAALADALGRVASDPVLRKELGDAARAKARGPAYGRARFTADLERVLTAVLR